MFFPLNRHVIFQVSERSAVATQAGRDAVDGENRRRKRTSASRDNLLRIGASSLCCAKLRDEILATRLNVFGYVNVEGNDGELCFRAFFRVRRGKQADCCVRYCFDG